MKNIFYPFAIISKSKQLLIVLFWFLLLMLTWFVGTAGEKHLFPSPVQVFEGFSSLFNEGLVVHIFSSLKLCFLSISIAIILSAFWAYLWPIPVIKVLSEFITKLRFLPLAGLTLYITLVIHEARNMQIWIMVIFLTTFLTTSLISVVSNIPQEEFDHAKTLKCSKFETIWQVIILGRLDFVIDVIRQNLAITWMMLVTVESTVSSEGGLGFLIKNSEKFSNHGRIIALQIIILCIGLLLDWSINYLRKALFRYSKI